MRFAKPTIGLVLVMLLLQACSVNPFRNLIRSDPSKGWPSDAVAYQNGARLEGGKPDFKQDVKLVVPKGDKQLLTNYPDGYSLELPAGLKLDLSLSSAFLRASGADLDVKISREQSPYADLDMYFADYLNRFISRPEYRTINRIEIKQDGWVQIQGHRTRLISFTRQPAPGSPETQNSYVFAYMTTGGREFYNFFFRTGDLAKNQPVIDQILASFKKVPALGRPVDRLDFHPVLPNWNAETAAFYQNLVATKQVMWGFFYPWAVTKDYAPVAKVEEKLGYKFPILLHYMYLGQEFPSDGLKRAYDRGQVVELTMQVAGGNNDNQPRVNMNFDVLDGVMDGAIREFARAAKAFGHPFIFRLNNEMNTDWSQYSGVLTLSDPDIYIKVWQRIYRIFQEERVDNAIWVFNPNDHSYPPTRWNSHLSYYPGNDYVQILGITGYNTGDYFRDVTGEHWRSFNEIYSSIAEQYRPMYSRFPWMITEFASSSVGGDKADWIREMFRDLPKYPEIKAAVWWSYFDPDYRPGKEGTPGRRYWLDEKDEYLQVFKQGITGKL